MFQSVELSWWNFGRRHSETYIRDSANSDHIVVGFFKKLLNVELNQAARSVIWFSRYCNLQLWFTVCSGLIRIWPEWLDRTLEQVHRCRRCKTADGKANWCVSAARSGTGHMKPDAPSSDAIQHQNPYRVTLSPTLWSSISSAWWRQLTVATVTQHAFCLSDVFHISQKQAAVRENNRKICYCK